MRVMREMRLIRARRVIRVWRTMRRREEYMSELWSTYDTSKTD